MPTFSSLFIQLAKLFYVLLFTFAFPPLVILTGLIYFGYKLLRNIEWLEWYEKAGLWLNDEEKSEYKKLYQQALDKYKNNVKKFEVDLQLYNEKKEKFNTDFIQYQEKILKLKQQADDNGISKNLDGSYSQRSHLGKKIQQEINVLQSKLDLEQEHYKHLEEPNRPNELEDYLSIVNDLSMLPKDRWIHFNNSWEEYYSNKAKIKALLWAFYSWCITLGVLLVIRPEGLHALVEYEIGIIELKIGLVVIITFIITLMFSFYFAKKEVHDIPVPKLVTLENIDTYLESNISINHLCQNFKCFWKDINKFEIPS